RTGNGTGDGAPSVGGGGDGACLRDCVAERDRDRRRPQRCAVPSRPGIARSMEERGDRRGQCEIHRRAFVSREDNRGGENRCERGLTEQMYGEELKRLDALLATLAQGTKAYEQAMRERAKLEQDFARQAQANTDRLEIEQSRKWSELGNSIKASFNAALDGALFEGKSFGQFLLAVAEGVAKDRK